MVQLGLETKPTLQSSMLRMAKETFKLSHVHRHWGLPAGTDGCCLLFSELGDSRYRSRGGTLNPLPISQLLLGAGGEGVWEAGGAYDDTTQTQMLRLPAALESAERQAHPEDPTAA